MMRVQNQDRRNRDIFAKYKYLTEERRMRFDDAISKVAVDFYLSEASVIKIIRALLQEGDEFQLPKPAFTGFPVKPREKVS